MVSVTCHQDVCIICLVYIPPNADQTYLSNTLDFLQSLPSYKSLIICEDFNVPDINWDVLSGSTSFSSDLCDLIVDLNLTQHVTVPIHKGGNILDIILTNFDIEELSVNPDLPPNTTSDHFLITFLSLLSLIRHKPPAIILPMINQKQIGKVFIPLLNTTTLASTTN